MDTALLDILACPKCRGTLEFLSRTASSKEHQGLACAACKVVYPIQDGIPVLLIEEAIPGQTWAKESTDSMAL